MADEPTRTLILNRMVDICDKEYGIKLGRDGLFTYLRAEGLLAQPVRRYTKTTFIHHRFRKNPNLYKDQTLTGSEQVFVIDITYVESDEGVHYLSLAMDAHTHKIMGHHLCRI